MFPIRLEVWFIFFTNLNTSRTAIDQWLAAESSASLSVSDNIFYLAPWFGKKIALVKKSVLRIRLFYYHTYYDLVSLVCN